MRSPCVVLLLTHSRHGCGYVSPSEKRFPTVVAAGPSGDKLAVASLQASTLWEGDKAALSLQVWAPSWSSLVWPVLAAHAVPAAPFLAEVPEKGSFKRHLFVNPPF